MKLILSMNLIYLHVLATYKCKNIDFHLVYSLQNGSSTPANERVIQLLEEVSCFRRNFVRKYFRIRREYSDPRDFLIDLRDDEEFDSILECEENFSDFIQVDLEIRSERVADDGEI